MAGRPSHVQSDRELMKRVGAGDEGAFTSVYRQQACLLFSVIFQILQDQKEAEDVLRDSFVQVWRKASTYDAGRGSVSSWSVMIARRKAIDKLRSKKRYYLATNAAAVESVLQSGGRAEESTDRGILINEERKRVQTALGVIGDAQREAISLAFFSGLSHPQIAERLNAPLGTVKARICRGLFALREVLDESP